MHPPVDTGSNAAASCATSSIAGATLPQASGEPQSLFVGIGSSAGGLEALTALLPGLPTGLGLRFVVVQHMSPTHRSMMAQLLGRITPLEVLEVTDGCVPLPDKVYVTPPNKNVVLREDGRLHLMEPPNETVPKPSVNMFFNSMADVVSDRAIGVVLSGTGSDGAVGLHAIKSSTTAWCARPSRLAVWTGCCPHRPLAPRWRASCSGIWWPRARLR